MEFPLLINEENTNISAKTTIRKLSKKCKRKQKEFDLEEDDITEGLFIIIIFCDQFPKCIQYLF